MDFRVLGPVELWSAGQQWDLGPARARCVLAMLLLTPGTILPAGTMIDRLWDDQPPPKARESLSVYIARLRASLRRALDGSPAGEVRLVGRASGYELDVNPEAVDLHRFRRLRRQADALAAGGDPEQAALLLREADAFWRGQALAGLRGDWAARMRDSLAEERRAALLKRVECELELGRHADLVGELHHLLSQQPLDEAFAAHQMMALYRSGRLGDALSLYRETRARMVAEQGTEPGPLLADLHQRMLRHDPGLAGPQQHPPRQRSPQQRSPQQRPPQQPSLQQRPPDTLPPGPVEFVGRRAELELLTQSGPEDGPGIPQVSVIRGEAGVGKTALAAEAARTLAGQYPDGIHVLHLHTHDPQQASLGAPEALHGLLRLLTAPATPIPDDPGERAALLRAQLSRRRAIVILDDAAGQDQILPLLPAAGGCLIIITTRHDLSGLPGAGELTLGALPLTDAVRLFRLAAGLETDCGDDEAAMAVRLCERLPLAIQLVAGGLAGANPPRISDLIEELSQPPQAPAGDGVAAPGLLPAFELAYRSLEPSHQRFLRRLGMNPCLSVSLYGAAALAGATLAQTRQAVAALLDHHLLDPAPAGQFGFHDLIREYAAEQAAEEDSSAQRRQAVGRLLDYYLVTADRADRLLHPFRRRAPGPPAAQPGTSPALAAPEDAAAWLEAEWRNILQAARYADRHEWKQQAADLIHLLGGFLEIRAYWDEAIAAHTMALQASRALGDSARIARASLALSGVSQQTGRHEGTLSLAEEAVEIYRSLGDLAGEAEALDQLGLAHQRAGRSREALACFHEAKIAYQDADDTHGVAAALSHLGIASWQLGRYPDAKDHLNQALALYQAAGDRRGQAKTLNNRGKMQLSFGYHRDALDDYQKSLEIFREIGGAQNEAILYHNIGGVYHYKGDYSDALSAYLRALRIYRDIGDLPDEADVLNDIGAICLSAERYDEALGYHERAHSIAAEIGDLTQRVIALRGMAGACRGSGRYEEAFEHDETALTLARQIGDPYEEAKALEGIAETTIATRRPGAARIVLRQALDIFERLDVPEAESARIRMEAIGPAFSARPRPAQIPI